MRVTNSPASRKRRGRMLTAAKGFRLKRSKLYRYASDAVDHGRQYAYRDRRTKKRNSAISGRSASTPPPAPPA
jgi:large subunit ribosomal protein L20